MRGVSKKSTDRKKRTAAKARLALVEGKGKSSETGTSFRVRKVRIGVDKKRTGRLYRTDNAAYASGITWWNFLPKAIYYHSYDVPIAWHLLISLCNYSLPQNDRFTTWYCLIPVCIILGYRVLWDMMMTLRAATQDSAQNSRMILHLDLASAGFRQVRWEQLRVGDIVCLRDGEESPADIVFISCSNPEGTAYADTSGWLGTSELLLKYAVKESKSDNTVPALMSLAGSVVCPHPMEFICMNRRWFESFSGSLKLRTYPRPTVLSSSNLIIRGTRVVDVDHIFGIVVYCGKDAFMNRVHRPMIHKRGFLSHLSNRLSLLTLFLIFIALLIDMISHGMWLALRLWFQDLDRDLTSSQTGVAVMTSLLRHLHLIPLVAIPTLDLQRYFQARRIAQDPRLSRSLANGDFVPAEVNAIEVVEHLGTVDIAVFDKTGTITTGDLHFNACSIGLRDYGKTDGVVLTTAVLTDASDLAEDPSRRLTETDSMSTPTALGDAESNRSGSAVSDASPSSRRTGQIENDSLHGSPLSGGFLTYQTLHGQAKRRSTSLIPGPGAPVPNKEVREAWSKLRQLREQSEDSSLNELPSCSEREITSSTDEDKPPYRDLVQVRMVRHTGERRSELPSPKPIIIGGVGSPSAEQSHRTISVGSAASGPKGTPKNPLPRSSVTSVGSAHHSTLAANRQQASLPPPCPGLLDATYLPRPLTYPQQFRDDLNYVVNRNSLTFTDRSFFEGFTCGGKQTFLTIHFCRALALCNSVRPILVTTQLPRPLHARTEPDRRMSRKTTLTSPSARTRTSAASEFCRRRPTEGPANFVFDSSMGAPYLSLLNWQITPLRKKSDQDALLEPEHLPSKARNDGELSPTKHLREELWNPRYIGYLRLKAKKREDICCVATAARLGFALVSRTGDYADLDINGQFRRFELLGTTSPNSDVTTIVCRQEDEFGATLYAKGTEASITCISELSSNQRKALKRRLRIFSRAGFRPIVIAYRVLSRHETRAFRKAYDDIHASLYKASDRFNKVCRKLHTRLKILAVVFLRDELTSGTEECFSLLKQAGCAVWVMSGDRLGPTVQAATCAKLITSQTRLFYVGEIWRKLRMKHKQQLTDAKETILSEETFTKVQKVRNEESSGALVEGGHELKRELFELFAEFRRIRCKTTTETGLCCVFSSSIIATLLSRTEFQTVFILMACESDSLIGYNLTPPQKAATVTVLQLCLSPSPVVMAVGDSIGDSDMLCDASVGVSVCPPRSSQAIRNGTNFADKAIKNAADINISKLSSLQILLVCHGIDVLERNSRSLLLCIFKSGLVGWAVFFYSFVATTSSHRPFKADYMIPVILLAWTLFIPIFTLIYPQLTFPPNRNIAAAHYASSRGRAYLKPSGSIMAVVDGFVSSAIMMETLIYMGNFNNAASDGTIRPVLQDCTALLAVILILARFVQVELMIPVAPKSYIFAASLLAAIPVLIGCGVYFWVHPDSLQFFAMPQILLTAFCTLLINVLICYILISLSVYIERGTDTVARLSQFSRMESGNLPESMASLDPNEVTDIRQADTQLLSSPSALNQIKEADHSIDGEALSQMEKNVIDDDDTFKMTRVIGISEVIRESVIFRLVSRLVPYTLVLYVNTKELMMRNDHGLPLLDGSATTKIDSSGNSGKSQSLTAKDTINDNTLMNDVREVARHSFTALHKVGQQGIDEEIEDAALIDDVVSVTSFNLNDERVDWSDDALDSQSNLDSSSSESTESSANLETGSSSDAGSMSQSMESLGSMGSEHRRSTMYSRLSTSHRRGTSLTTRDQEEKIEPIKAPTVDEDINSLLNTAKVRFKDQQLEEEYLEMNSIERQQFANCYRLFFVGCILLSLAEVWVQIGVEPNSHYWVVLPVLRLGVPVVFLSSSYTTWAWKHFDTLAYVEALVLLLSYLPTRFETAPPCHANGQFAIWTLVISRTPITICLLLNVLWLSLAVFGDSLRYSAPAVIYAGVFNLGVIAFAYFAGQRIHVTQRRRFLLNHQAEVSRRNQKEILNTMLPDFVVDKMLTHPINEDGIPEGLHAEEPGVVTVIFCDVYEFQNLVSILPATRLVELLDNLFLYFDKCAEQFGVVKIETVFETYLSCAGIQPGSGKQAENPVKDAFDALDMSLAMLEVTSYTRYEIYEDEEKQLADDSSSEKVRTERLRVKIGMHSGTVTSGVVGAKKPQYALFGDTVNTASRMKLTGEADHVHISDYTYNLLCDDTALSWQARQLEVKGKGLMTTYLLTAVTGSLYPHYATADQDVETEEAEETEQTSFAHQRHIHASLTHDAPIPGTFSTSSCSRFSSSDSSQRVRVSQIVQSFITEKTANTREERLEGMRAHIDIVANISSGGQPSYSSDYPAQIPQEVPPCKPLRLMRIARFLREVITRIVFKSGYRDHQRLTTGSTLEESLFSHMVMLPSMQISPVHGSDIPSSVSSIQDNSSKGPAHRDLFSRGNRRRKSRQGSLDPAVQTLTGESDLTQSLETRSVLTTTGPEAAVDEIDYLSSSSSSFGMIKYTQSMNFFWLTFRSPDLERRFAGFARRDTPYLRAIQSSIIIFLLVTAVTSVSRVYAEWTESLDGVIQTLFAPVPDSDTMPVFVDVDTGDDSVLGYWWIRAFEMLFGFLVWLMFHISINNRNITTVIKSDWAVDAAGFLYFLAMTVFLVTPTWRSVAERRTDDLTWHWHSDTTELGFCFMILHHNSGLLFHNLLLLDVLVITLVIVFLSIVLTPTFDTRLTIPLAPLMFVFQIISAYIKEAFTRYTWFATQDFLSTEDRARELLSDMLPKQVLEDFKTDNLKLAYHHEKITFLFADIVGFTSYAKSVEAKDVVRLLQKLFARFDRDSTRFQLYKLCTIGDAYVAVTEPGVEGDENFNPVPGADQVWSMAKAMLRNIREVAQEVNVPHLNMRIGLHFGQCVGGVIGSGRLRYDFWGMDVLAGNSMESAGAPGQINCSETLKSFLEASFPQRFDFKFNKTVNVLYLAVNSYFVSERASLPDSVTETELDRSRTAGQRREGKRRLSMLGTRPDQPNSQEAAGERSVTLNKTEIAGLEKLRAMYGELKAEED